MVEVLNSFGFPNQGSLGPKTKKRGSHERCDLTNTRMDKTRFSGWLRIDRTGVIAEIVFGKGAIFGANVIGNLQQIVTDIGGKMDFIGLIAILIIFAILQRSR